MNEVTVRKMTEEDRERIEKNRKSRGFIGWRKKAPRKGDLRWPKQRNKDS